MKDRLEALLPSIRIRNELRCALEDLANRDKRDLSDYVRLILEEHVLFSEFTPKKKRLPKRPKTK